ncbi:hypothetical protein ACS0TY_021454 [Phlomoides rotata]
MSVPRVKDIKDKKTRHKQALELVNYMCHEMASLPENEAWIMLQYSITRVSKHNISEIVEVIMDMYHVVTGSTNNIGGLMHMCARLTPVDRLNLVPGAALHMQRKLQWFNLINQIPSKGSSVLHEMEKFVPHQTESGQTKKVELLKCYSHKHEKLKTEGERWMKDTGNACSIATALITIVEFAATFTVHGGVSFETGIPIFQHKCCFLVQFHYFSSVVPLHLDFTL